MGAQRQTIAVDLKLDVLEDEWAAVPILPAGTPLRSATINGKPVQLMHRDGSLVWGTKKAGSYTMKLVYSADAVRSDAGFVIPIPLPQAAATQFKATVPGTGLDMAVIPAAGVKVTSSDGKTVLDATIPTTRGVQLSWREPVLDSHTISRAVYSGHQVGDALQWDVDLSVELSIRRDRHPRTAALARHIERDSGRRQAGGGRGGERSLCGGREGAGRASREAVLPGSDPARLGPAVRRAPDPVDSDLALRPRTARPEGSQRHPPGQRQPSRR